MLDRVGFGPTQHVTSGPLPTPACSCPTRPELADYKRPFMTESLGIDTLPRLRQMLGELDAIEGDSTPQRVSEIASPEPGGGADVVLLNRAARHAAQTSGGRLVQ